MDGYVAVNWSTRTVRGPVHYHFQAAALDLADDDDEVVNVEISEYDELG